MTELNTTDLQILDALQRDGSLTTQQIAERINISQSPCWRRVNRLQQSGIINRRVAILDREKLGMEVVVFATVNLISQHRKSLTQFEEEVNQHPEIVERLQELYADWSKDVAGGKRRAK